MMNLIARYGTKVLFALLLWPLAQPASAQPAQEWNPRFGLGFNTLLSTSDGVGLGVRGRASAPINQDLSVGIDLGFTGFILSGRRDATYVFDPQVSLILTFPAVGARSLYYLGGIGAYVPLTDDETDVEEGGPTLHGGVGWVHALYETTFFYEVNPALIVGAERIHLAVPFRVGLIF